MTGGRELNFNQITRARKLSLISRSRAFLGDHQKKNQYGNNINGLEWRHSPLVKIYLYCQGFSAIIAISTTYNNNWFHYAGKKKKKRKNSNRHFYFGFQASFNCNLNTLSTPSKLPGLRFFPFPKLFLIPLIYAYIIYFW